MTDTKPKRRLPADQNRAIQQAFRQRKADADMAEIRGIYAPKDQHAELKAKIRSLLNGDDSDA